MLKPPIRGLMPHAATTDGITVRVGVTYLSEQSQPAEGKWFWSYHIRIENGREAPVQLLTRHWTIVDADGDAVLIEGDGVVGEQPVIGPGQAHDYVSGCPLGTATGHMEGHYRLIDQDGDVMRVAIPRFPLTAPASAR